MEITITNIWPDRNTIVVEGVAKKTTRSGWIKITPKEGIPFTAHWMDVSDHQGRLMTHPEFGS